MKKILKGYLSGFISAAVILGCITGFAARTTTLYDVIAEGVEIVIDGQKLIPTDANGNIVEPIIYNGTTYLPVRAIANAFDKPVYWDGPNYTVYLGQVPPPGGLEYPTVELEDMVSINEDPNETDELTDNYGNEYQRAIINFAYDEFEYLLNMKYSRFKGTLYVPEGSSGDSEGFLRIIADGKTIYKSPNMTPTSYPVKIDIDVTGYNDLKIEFSGIYNSGTFATPMCLGDAGFYQ